MVARLSSPTGLLLAGLATGLVACGAGSSGGSDAGEGGDGTSDTRSVATIAAEDLDLSSLTDAQLAGQRVIATFRDTGAPSPALLRLIRRGELAGVILFSREAPDVRSARRLADRLQAEVRRSPVPLPLLVMVDQEGGDGRTTGARRLRDAPPRRSAAQQGAAGVATTRAAGRETGRALRRAGVNVNLAPVADVGRRGAALVREGRVYGSNAATVGRLTAAFVAGQRPSGVASTLKHFPGFGAATVNTDNAPARVALAPGTLRRIDEAAFGPGLKAGAGLVMLANAVYPRLDRVPAPFSRRIAVGELRDRVGFEGVSISDDLEATGLDAFGAPAVRARRAAAAGVDLALLGRRGSSAVAAHRAITSAITAGTIRRADAEASARRVLALRASLRPR